jgi:hypothetical protein
MTNKYPAWSLVAANSCFTDTGKKVILPKKAVRMGRKIKENTKQRNEFAG